LSASLTMGLSQEGSGFARAVGPEEAMNLLRVDP